MRFTIKPRDGSRAMEFFAPDGGGYIRLESDGRPGVLGRQICQGGGFRGATLVADTESELAAVCRAWRRAYIRNERNA